MTNKELSKSNSESESFKAGVSPSDSFITILNSFGDFIYVSPNCIDFFGFMKEDLLGKSSYDFFHAEDFETISASHYSIINNSSSVLCTIFRLRNSNGDYQWVESISHSIKIEEQLSGNIFCVLKKIK